MAVLLILNSASMLQLPLLELKIWSSLEISSTIISSLRGSCVFYPAPFVSKLFKLVSLVLSNLSGVDLVYVDFFDPLLKFKAELSLGRCETSSTSSDFPASADARYSVLIRLQKRTA